MQNAAGGGTPAQSDGRNDSHRSIVSDLVALIERVQESMKLIEAAIAAESPLANQDPTVIALDDVTPRYARAYAELTASNAGLGMALHLLLDSRTSGQEMGRRDENAGAPVRTIGHA
jgi:hypothetical protein